MRRSVFDGIAELEANRDVNYKVPGLAESKKVGGLKGFLAGLLPTVGGAVGAVGGSVIAPFAGTVAGGAGGSALGEYLRQRLTGEDKDGIDKGNLVEQAAFGAIGSLGKAKALTKAGKAKNAGGAAEFLQSAQKESKLTKAGRSMQEDVRGTGIGTTVSKTTDKTGRLKPSTASKINADIDSLPGKTPAEKLAALEARQAAVGSKLGESVSASNRATSIGDLDTITTVAGKQSKKIQGWDKDIASEANSTIAGAKNLDELYTVRKDLDSKLNSYYKAATNDTTATAKGDTLKAYRDGIDKVLKSSVDGFDDLNKAYSQGFKTQDVLLRSSGKSNNLKIFGIDTGIGGETIAKGKEAAGGMLRKAGGDAQAAASGQSGFTPFARQVPRQVAAQAMPRLFAAPFMGAPQEQQDAGAVDFSTDIIDTGETFPNPTPELPNGTSGPLDPITKQPIQQSPFTQENIQQAILADLQATGGKNVGTYMKLYETFKPEEAPAEKPLSAEAAKSVSNALAGTEAIGDFERIVAEDPGVLKKTIIPGRGLFAGALGSVLGTGEVEAASQQIIDIIARLRTGAAISATEEARFKKFIPQAFDSPEVREQKIGYLKRQFERVAQRSGSAGNDLEAAIQ